MYITLIFIVTLFGGVIGALSAVPDGLSAMVVLALVGAGFGCPIGVGFCLLVHAIRTWKNPSGTKSPPVVEDTGGERVDPFAQMKMAQHWSDERERSRIAEDLDSTSKSVTGW